MEEVKELAIKKLEIIVAIHSLAGGILAGLASESVLPQDQFIWDLAIALFLLNFTYFLIAFDWINLRGSIGIAIFNFDWLDLSYFVTFVTIVLFLIVKTNSPILFTLYSIVPFTFLGYSWLKHLFRRPSSNLKASLYFPSTNSQNSNPKREKIRRRCHDH